MLTKNNNIIFIIAHYDSTGYLAKHILQHIKYIHSFAEQIIFVSTHLKLEHKEILSPYANVIVRANTGYDFWSYRLGLDLIEDIHKADHIIMWNSSFVCLQPEKLYQRFLAGITTDGMYGLSSCSAPAFHLQSYFFSFYGKSVIFSSAFKGWWEQMTPVSDRDEVIRKYEVGMSNWFAEHHIPLRETTVLSMKDIMCIIPNYFSRVRFNFDLIRKLFAKRFITGYKALNITHFGWKKLFREYGIVKVELLIFNPTHQQIRLLKWMINSDQEVLLKDAIGEKFHEIFNQ